MPEEPVAKDPTLKDVRFEMRLTEELVERLNRWRQRQDDPPSRAEAIRQLVVMALDAEAEAAAPKRKGKG